MNFEELIKNVERWAYDKKLLPGSPEKQTLKLMEEAGELAGALLRGDRKKSVDGIGDCFVVLIILSRQLGFLPEICWLKQRRVYIPL